MPLQALTPDMVIVFGFLAMVILLFVFDIVRVDMVGMLLMVLLPLSGVISPEKAISGLSSNAVVSIIAVIIIGHGLDSTGVMNIFAVHITKLAGTSRIRIMTLISGTVAVISGFMQNIGAAALFMPVANRICRQLNIPVSQILLPMGYCAVIGGCITLVGSSSLILLNDLMASCWENSPALSGGGPLEPFGLFSVAPIGICLVICAVIYFMLFGRQLLPETDENSLENLPTHSLEDTYGSDFNDVFELSVPEGFHTRRLEELNLRKRYHSIVVRISKHRGRYRIMVPGKWDVIEPGDAVGIISNRGHAAELAGDMGWTLLPKPDYLSGLLSPDHSGKTEAVITPRSELVGKTLHEYGFRKKLKLNPLALFRRGRVILEDISKVRIQAGDAFLLFGDWEQFHLVRSKHIMAFTEHINDEVMHPEKAWRAVFCLVLALGMALGFKIQLSISLLAGAAGMILSRVMTLDEAYRSVDWMTVFLLAGLLPLGLAFQSTGAAGFITDALVSCLDEPLTPFYLFLLIGCLTSFFTLVISNVGATVLMIPLAMNMAHQSHADPRMAALLVAVASSNTFILPTHQVNALVMRPGGYRIKDYMRAGTGMTIIFMSVVMTLLYFFYGIEA